jgi:hypothetical protein
MIQFVDSTIDPFISFLADWSIRWGVLIVGLAVWFWARSPRRAATRHLICATTLAAGLILPFAPRWGVPWAWPCREPARALERIATAEAASGPARQVVEAPLARSVRPAPRVVPAPAELERQRTALPASVDTVATQLTVSTPRLRAWQWVRLGLAGAWLAGALVTLVRLVVGHGILARLRSSSRPIAGVTVASASLNRDARRIAGLAAHPAVGSPVVVGGLAPLILVPDDWDALPESSRRACLLHELAHLDRRDDLAKLAAEFVTVPFWFHPAVFWLLARLDCEAELACDDVAIGQGVSPRELASLLAVFAARPFRLDLRGAVIARQGLTFFDRNTVALRITRLLEDDMTRTAIPASTVKSLGHAAIVAALALLIGGASLRALEPEQPQQTASVPAPKPAQAAAVANSLSVVVNDESAHPIEGATVVAGIITAGTARDVIVARTGADGLARFDRVLNPEMWIVAFKKGHAFASRNLFGEKGAAPTALALPRPRAFSGTVRDPEGRPLPGAEVRVEAAHASTGQVLYFAPAFGALVAATPIERALLTRSDALGCFSLESLPEAANVSLKISAAGMATARTQVQTSSRRGVAGTDAVTAIVLAAEAKVAGRVVSAVPGVGVAGRAVTLHGVFEGSSSTLSGKATTDAEGRFMIGGLGAGRANILVADVPADGLWTFRAASDVTLVAGATAQATIEVVPGVVVSGSVASTDGKPIGGVSIAAYGARNPRTGSQPVTTVSDAAGFYRFRMPPGVCFVTLSGRVPGYTTPGGGESNRSLVIPDGQKAFSVPPFVMARGVNLVGRIVDATGTPLPGAKLIGVCNQTYCSPLNQSSATADAEGAFSLDTQADGQPIPLNEAVTFQVRLADGQEFDASLVPTGAREVTIKLPTLKHGGPKGPDQVAPDDLAGIVVDTQGRPIEGVLAHPYSWVPHLRALTDKAGRFRVKVPEQGKIEIRFTKEGYEPREFLGQQTGQPGWVVVMGNTTFFEGRLVDASGKPVADVPIRANSGQKRMWGGGIMTECWTDGKSGKDGSYRLYVEPGMYEFQVRASGVGVARMPKQAIASDEAKTLNIALDAGVDFEAHVVDAQDGKPIAGFILKDWRNPSVAGTSDARGILKIPAMMPGAFSFGMVQAAGYARWWSDSCLHEWTRFQKADRFGFQRNLDGLDFEIKPGMPPVTIHVEKAVTIRGRVVDPSGEPIAGATVAPALTGSGNSLTGDTRFSVETDQKGAFTMRLPASGEIAYNLVAHDGKFQRWRTWANGILPPFRTKPGDLMEDVTIRLTRPAIVRGRVIDAAGQPVTGREVRASAADKQENRYYDPTTKTRADGTFELRFIRPGAQHIQVAPFWLYAESAPTESSRTVTLAEGETKTGIELTAAPER